MAGITLSYLYDHTEGHDTIPHKKAGTNVSPSLLEGYVEMISIPHKKAVDNVSETHVLSIIIYI